jgi:cytochrome c-type biogenesis protein CcmE
MTGRPRLVIALVVAAMLVAFMGYQIMAGASQLVVSVGQLRSNQDGAAHRTVQLSGMVVAAHGNSSLLRFVLRDDGSAQSVPVVYHGSIPDPFRVGRRVLVTGKLENGAFQAQQDSLITKCPSKYSAGGGGQ